MTANPIATKWGRLLTFFALYITEGIPLGFTATAMATQMRRGGLSPDQIGLFIGSLYLPWAWKWMAGPFVDLIYSNRFGRRRAWIVGTQVLMVATLLACMPFDLVSQLKWIVAILYVHNTCCAVQDVAIDALACGTLKEDERGTANGLMFAGQALGQSIGGAGVLYLLTFLGRFEDSGSLPQGASMNVAYWFIGAALLVVTFFVALPIREEPLPRAATGGDALSRAASEVVSYVRVAAKSFVGSRTAFVGLIIAILPAGAIALGLALQNNLAVELGFSDNQIADLSLFSTLAQAAGCLCGGLLSDRFGRKKTLAFFLLMTAIPTAYLGWEMQRHDWIMPAPEGTPLQASTDTSPERPAAKAKTDAPPADDSFHLVRRTPPDDLVTIFWYCTVIYNAFYGLMTGSQIPLFMEITNPAVAATQFTAYMALHNLATSYTAAWQGFSMTTFGYPKTLWIDSVVGLIGISLLPLLVLSPRSDTEIAAQRDADLGHPGAPSGQHP